MVTGVSKFLALAALLCGDAAHRAAAHSASDAYLTLTVEKTAAAAPSLIHGQWDVALRDLDFVLHLDDDGDGRLTWGEVRRHRAAMERFAYRHLRVGSATTACSLKPRRSLIDNHADGAYVALFFDVVCAPAQRQIALSYDLFFDIDPSHRGIFVMHSDGNVATALLSPQNNHIPLGL